MAAIATEDQTMDTMANTSQTTDVWSDDWWTKCSDNLSLKRTIDPNEEDMNKRFRDKDYISINGHEEEEEEYREITAEEHMIMNISNQLVNFSMNMQPMPEWPEVYERFPEEPIRPKPAEPEFPPKTGQLVHGYHLDKLIATGKRTAVFLGRKEKKPDEEVVIKIGMEMGFHCLQSEHNNYGKLRGSKSVVKILDYIWWRVYREDCSSIRWGLIVLEKCGPSLADLMIGSSGGVMKSIENLFEIAIKMIDAIEGIHEKGFIHCSLKPEHFVLENDQNPDCLKVIGLSASKSFLKMGTNQHIDEQSDRKLPKGDPNFHSIGYHNGYRRSRRDDMESLGYCLIYLTKGSLPWMITNKDLTSSKVIRNIGHNMQSTSLEDLCRDLPNNFLQYFRLLEKYQFSEKPDYEELRNCFRLDSNPIPQ